MRRSRGHLANCGSVKSPRQRQEQRDAIAAALVLMSVVLGCHIVRDTGARQRDHRAAQARRRRCTFSRTAEREKQPMAAPLRPPLPLSLSLLFFLLRWQHHCFTEAGDLLQPPLEALLLFMLQFVYRLHALTNTLRRTKTLGRSLWTGDVSI